MLRAHTRAGAVLPTPARVTLVDPWPRAVVSPPSSPSPLSVGASPWTLEAR